MQESYQDLFPLICRGIQTATEGSGKYLPVYNPDSPEAARHEFLFFLKPELTANFNVERFRLIYDLITNKIDGFNLKVNGVFILPGVYLEKYGIISEHYGVIDNVARKPLDGFSEQAVKSFKREFGLSVNEANVVGAFEYLKLHPELDPDTIATIWLSREYQKLAGGTYAEYFKEEDLYLVNGFYPRLLRHFTKSDSCTVSVVLAGDVSWGVARKKFMGTTNPENAEKGSIRALLLSRQKEFALDEISANLNGVHLSAGPVEGLVELHRFTADFTQARSETGYNRFRFAKELGKVFTTTQIENIIKNVNVRFNNENISIFDLTEEMDADSALEILQKVSDQLG
jgi:nucleoside diphosphate kinase